MSERKHALAFILITIFIDTVGLGIIIPVIPDLIMSVAHVDAGKAAVYGGWLFAIYGIAQFFFAPVIGNLSDQYGRRPVLILALLAFAADYGIMGWAPTLTWLFIGRAIAGIAGSSVTTANAYIADISPPDKVGANFGLMGAAWGVGFIIGPVIGGLVGEYGTRLPFFVAAGLGFANAIYGMIVLPESLSPENRRTFSLKRANPLGALMQIRRFPMVLGFIIALLFYQIAHDANPSTWTYYTIEKFDWSKQDIGLGLGYVGAIMIFSHGYLTGLSIRKIGERRTVFLGLTMSALGFGGISFATQSWMLFAFITPFCLGSMAIPALRGIMVNHVSADVQGELQGTITSLVSVTAIAAPIMMTQLFGYFTSDDAPVYFPGAPFLFASAMVVVSLIIVSATMMRHKEDAPAET